MEKDVLKNQILNGSSIRDMSKNLNTSSSNIRYWLGKHGLKSSVRAGPKLENDSEIYNRCLDLVSKNPIDYNYLFGLYLGDGCVSCLKANHYTLNIFQDLKYPRHSNHRSL
jgi:DNA-binding transcriptional regulator WhiA